MLKLVELQQQRAALVKSMRALVDGVDAAKGMSAEQSAQFDAMNQELTLLDEAIKREEAVAALEASLHEIPETILRPTPIDVGAVHPLASAEYLQAYDLFIRSGLTADLRGALTIGTDSEGGFTVPQSWADVLIQKLTNNVVLRQLATVIPTENTRNLPVVTDNGAAGWIGESNTYTESDIAFNGVALKAHKLGRIIKISEELLEDSGVNLIAEVSRIFAATFGVAEELAFVNGDGTSKPTGILQTALTGKTAAAVAAITYDEMMDLYYAVREPYRMNGTWLMKGATAGMLRKMKSSDGVPLWQPSLQLGQPDIFNGHPLRTTEAMPLVAAEAKPVVFGDFSQYQIADRGGIAMQRLDELYAAEGMVGFKMRKRVDGVLAVPEAVQTLEMAAG